MYILNILSTIKKMTIEKLKVFLFENYYRRIALTKENSYYSMKHHKKQDLLLLATKLIEKIPDASSDKQYHKSYLRGKTKNW